MECLPSCACLPGAGELQFCNTLRVPFACSMFVMRKVLCALEWYSGVLQRQILCYGHAAGETAAEQTLVIIMATIKVKSLIYRTSRTRIISLTC